MRVVHGLKGDPGVIAIEVAVLDKILDGVDDLHTTVLVICRLLNWLSGIDHIRASEGWPVPIVLPTLESGLIGRFFAHNNLFDLGVGRLTLDGFVCVKVFKMGRRERRGKRVCFRSEESGREMRTVNWVCI